MYISRNGRVWALPYGADYLGEDARGVPLYSTGEAVCEAKPVTPRTLGRSAP